MEFLFWILLIIIFYSYIGYGLVLYTWYSFQKKNNDHPSGETIDEESLPEITLFIAAYNEYEYLEEKILNSLDLDYPQEKLTILFVTDGSDDGSYEYLRKDERVQVIHEPERKGKINAMNRGMKSVKTPYVVFTDCNTYLGRNSLLTIAHLFEDKEVGCVSGEKRIFGKKTDTASGSGEGIYWQYESAVKHWEASLHTTIGAAGELFAIRTELFEEVEPDTILDDFIISMRIAMRGYKIAYHPNAYAIEAASLNVKEEMKRKVRIASGSIQSILRLKALLNPFQYPLLSWQYLSHKVLRWTLTPVSIALLVPLNAYLMLGGPENKLYWTLGLAQAFFYLLAAVGWFLQGKQTKTKLIFVPYYFCFMNYAQLVGIFRYLKGKQSVNWEKAGRSKPLQTH